MDKETEATVKADSPEVTGTRAYKPEEWNRVLRYVRSRHSHIECDKYTLVDIALYLDTRFSRGGDVAVATFPEFALHLKTCTDCFDNHNWLFRTSRLDYVRSGAREKRMKELQQEPRDIWFRDLLKH